MLTNDGKMRVLAALDALPALALALAGASSVASRPVPVDDSSHCASRRTGDSDRRPEVGDLSAH